VSTPRPPPTPSLCPYTTLFRSPTLTGSDAGSGLKQLAKTLLGDDATAPDAEEARKQVFRAAGWLEKIRVDTPPERSGWAEIDPRSEEHTSELQSRENLVCRLLL